MVTAINSPEEMWETVRSLILVVAQWSATGNLASLAQYGPVKKELATWLPQHDAEGHPKFNGQKAMNDKYKAREAKH